MKFKQKFVIEKKQVGQGCPVFVIAEAGSNHDGSLAKARKLIDAAARLGADAVKFQSYSAHGLVNPQEQPHVYKIIEKIATPASWLEKLAEHAKNRGVVFLDTPFDEEQLEELERIGVSAYKIASGDLTYLPFVEAVAKTRKPIFLSVGCANMEDIAAAVETIKSAGNNKLVLLQCVVSYPTEWKDANVSVLHTLRNAFGCPVGYSDHSHGDLIPVLAVANGACAIEKHYTFDRMLPGPDHPFAMELHELEEMIKKIRAVPGAMGSPVKDFLPCEKEEKLLARRGVYAAVNIDKGTPITADMLLMVRPAKGLEPGRAGDVIGRKASKNIRAFEPITQNCV